jgi:hypothetical protein
VSTIDRWRADGLYLKKRGETMSNDFFEDFDWIDLALAGSMAEEMSEQERERRTLEREMQDDDTEPCCCDDEPCA